MGYKHTARELQESQNLSTMRKKVALFTVFYAMMAIELIFRLIDFMAWIYHPPGRPEYLNMDSRYDASYSASKRAKYDVRIGNAPYTMIQIIACLVLMLANSGIWLYNKKFSYTRHCIHYYVASALVLMFLPHPEFGATTGVKFAFMTVSLFLFQLALATAISPTGLH
mgnify:CR=1 FL=1